ncbi:GNAT family N-acetyltransferase [Microbacterium protaetiae]|uniref:GNAT family N-acetyltransferase n=1 Tax=Microbacterium protaetiae TaxID=2509458 RepID=A0A4P6ER35_9MICO|nr:GNAT family N-acetyltransferase [Microbacterium protaetiae]QAY60338.1 GNAT family N-acetyltransferase [Microbacterium protaetiae]
MTTGSGSPRRYVIAAMLNGMEVGTEFDRTQWPAHVTLVSNFTTEASTAKLAAKMRRALAPERPLQLEFGDTAMFGRDRDIPVRLVRSESAIGLHEELIAELSVDAHIVADEPAYWHAGYRPHVTLTPALGAGEALPRVSRNVVLARLDGGRATIVAAVRLSAGDGPVVGIDVRRADAGDAHDLAQLKIEWAQVDPSPNRQEVDEFADALSTWIAGQDDLLVVEVAVADGQIVGMAWMVLFERAPDFADRQRLTADIQSVYVTPAHRNRGIGRRLVDALCDAADARSVPRILVTASARSVPLYERSGFESSPLLLQRRAGQVGLERD